MVLCSTGGHGPRGEAVVALLDQQWFVPHPKAALFLLPQGHVRAPWHVQPATSSWRCALPYATCIATFSSWKASLKACLLICLARLLWHSMHFGTFTVCRFPCLPWLLLHCESMLNLPPNHGVALPGHVHMVQSKCA